MTFESIPPHVLALRLPETAVDLVRAGRGPVAIHLGRRRREDRTKGGRPLPGVKKFIYRVPRARQINRLRLDERGRVRSNTENTLEGREEKGGGYGRKKKKKRDI